jgi:hypothetical protein
MIKFSDIQDAFFFVSSAGYGLHTAILARDTGEMYWRSEEGDLDQIGDKDLPSDRHIQIPHRNELGLGQELVFEFVSEHLPDEIGQVRNIFGRRGAYVAFKDLLDHKGLLQTWYDFEHECEERALRRWCNDNELELSG